MSMMPSIGCSTSSPKVSRLDQMLDRKTRVAYIYQAAGDMAGVSKVADSMWRDLMQDELRKEAAKRRSEIASAARKTKKTNQGGRL